MIAISATYVLLHVSNPCRVICEHGWIIYQWFMCSEVFAKDPEGHSTLKVTGVLGQQFESRGLFSWDFLRKRASFSEKTLKGVTWWEFNKCWPIFCKILIWTHFWQKFQKKLKIWIKIWFKKGSFNERLLKIVCEFLKRGHLVRASQKRGSVGESKLKEGVIMTMHRSHQYLASPPPPPAKDLPSTCRFWQAVVSLDWQKSGHFGPSRQFVHIHYLCCIYMYIHTFQRLSRARPRGREWATLGVHPLSWLLSNNRLEEVCGTRTKGTFSSWLLLSNQDKGWTPSVAHSLPLPPGFCSTCLV